MQKIVLYILLLSGLLSLGSANPLLGQVGSCLSNIEYYTTDKGLSQNEITCILQDKKGFLWIGTRGGLNRFDGQNFRVFKNEIGNVNSLSNNSVESLYECSSGNIWIGTKSNGLTRYDPVINGFTHYKPDTNDTLGIKGNRIISLAEGDKGCIWIGTWSNGLSIFNIENNSYKSLLGNSRITKILKSSNEQMWVAATTGIYTFSLDGKQIRHYDTQKLGLNTTDLIEDQENGAFYLGSWNNGLWKLDPITETFSKVRSKVNDIDTPNNAYSLNLDSEGRVWVGSWSEGVSIYNPVLQTFTKHPLRSRDGFYGRELYRDILFIFEDKTGTTWLGTNGGGLCKVDNRGEQFGLMSGGVHNTGLPNEPIWSILEDHEGTLWVGVKGSEYLYYSQDRKTFHSLLIPRNNMLSKPKSKKGVRTIYQCKDDEIWFATNYSIYKIVKKPGFKIIPTNVNLFESSSSTRLRHVSTLYETSDGVFWIGQQQAGLKRSITPGNPAREKFKTYRFGGDENGIKSNRISAFLEDNSGRFWIGTYNGLHLYRPTKDNFIQYRKIQGDVTSISSNIVICLHEDKKGNLWIGTPNGLNMAIPGPDQKLNFLCLQEKDGLPDNYIHSILEDNNGHFWISTNKGISRFDPQSKVFVNFDINDGLQSNSFVEGVAIKSDLGAFYFGGINGLSIFHPDSIKRSNKAPDVVLTGLKIFNQVVKTGQQYNDRVILDKTIEYTKEITLTHSQNVFSINFAALDFQSPGSNTFKYKLEGLEDNWNHSNKQNGVTYSNLKPGEYTFHVKASNHNGLWSENQASLHLKILPPFWASWQSIIFYVLVFSGLLLLYRYFIYKQNELLNKLDLSRLELKKDKEIAEMKTQFFTNLTHELRTPLTLINGPIEVILEDKSLKPHLKNHLTIVHHHTCRLLNLVTQLLDFRKAESGNFQIRVAKGDFVDYAREIFLSFKDLAEEKKVLYQFHVSQHKMDLYFDSINMEIVLCNLLSNAFKNTETNGTISLSIRYCKNHDLGSKNPEDGYCEVVVEDSGAGMSKEVMTKIFDRYYQVVNTKSARIVGTGIGLSLVKNVVEMHRGTIEVESEINKGSKFILRIPTGKEHFSEEIIIGQYKNPEHVSHYQIPEKVFVNSRPQKVFSLIHQDIEKPKILIVEDNLEIRNFIHGIFENNYNVCVAENGREGVNKARDFLPDAIISDVMMPKMDGLEFCAFIKSNELTADIPFILLTARTSNVYKVDGFHSGADAYITKPFHPSVLISQVESLLLSRKRMKDRFSKLVTLQPTDIQISLKDEAFLKKTIEIIEKNIVNDALNRDFLAKSLAISASSLYRKIKSLTGLTTNAFVRSIRLKRAAQLMKKTQYNISEIAYQVGFNDLKYFRSCFKEQFGMNPSKYIDNEGIGDGCGERYQSA